ncbi:hypothetical protein GLAREA_04040 [Glarea lozoyensis ATCC 20868]|uniref:Uncharacterized protein n=1 Tax=Glarea lozoyensis (strain ATCC 20868 / MF5171) TaxID=1116229 RepID=S3DXH7_GLAL2|nr:uncharacterized protein GLAREA_04040 [Glarea lozoyensis ATCC 20868]EPE31073.1 hypothetical protein GLAREA_04040 [Glarea lozoyensis ATCC 20868]
MYCVSTFEKTAGGGADSSAERVSHASRDGGKVSDSSGRFSARFTSTWRQCPHPMKRVVLGLRPEAVVKGVVVCGSPGKHAQRNGSPDSRVAAS